MPSRNPISPERKNLYLAGQVASVIGLLLFLSNFVIMPMTIGQGFPSDPGGMMAGFAFRGVGGIVLLIAGGAMMNIARRGVAGSGLTLDPEQAREDLKPWNQMAGGMADDSLQEIGLARKAEKWLDSASNQSPTASVPAEVVKVRCRACKALNDEQAKFCDQCGAAL
ncbi:MAG: zinc ribbon domain-containing protein [Planctomycetales bacterium]